MATSVASRRLFSEYRALASSPPDGITAGPVSEDDIFLWEALIQGPDGTPYEGGIFPAELKFPKDYPLAPPTMKFLGEVWHPNGEFFSSPFPRSVMEGRDSYMGEREEGQEGMEGWKGGDGGHWTSIEIHDQSPRTQLIFEYVSTNSLPHRTRLHLHPARPRR